MARRSYVPYAALAAAVLVLFALIVSFERSQPSIDVPERSGTGPKVSDRSGEEAGRPSTESAPALGKAPAKPKVFAKGEAVVRGKWGGKPGEFGHRPAQESNPEAPMAIIAGAAGELTVVDQVNLRVQRFKNGEPVGSFSASETVQDVANLPGGKTALLDRLADKNIQVYGPDGQLANTAPIVGKGVPEGGRVTGLISDDKGIYVERDHTTLVRVADTSGNADTERPEIPGRPTRDGKWVVTLALTDRASGAFVLTAFDRGTFQAVWSKDLTIGIPILQVLTVDSDTAGNIYVAADTGQESSAPPYSIVNESITVLRINQGGSIDGKLELPAPATGDEMQRPVTIGDDGTVYEMVPSADGMSIMRYTF
jgi:hypothetical protein